MAKKRLCLNPYCSGQWSRTKERRVAWNATSKVLILIVVDNGLVRLIMLLC